MSGSETDLLCAEPSFPPSARTGPRENEGGDTGDPEDRDEGRSGMRLPVPQRLASFFEGEPPTRRKVACSEEAAASS